MLTIKYHASFKRDYKRIKKRGYDIRLLGQIIENLASGQSLDVKHHDHPLAGDWISASHEGYSKARKS
ncbi:MAG: type II toxin-antitoxin system YafQ family toxin [Synergistaceae bacterium]|nr:type II toxin-antitoxin system YafQ family toxin [Synergistaceae bacterium]